ncbi:hypothetical protein WKI27_12205 [Brevundimonas vesicularis]|uniref:hypothetical protein n=1 Tax=Brevundimonas vesicularis TaxID=41276 RepID=UPI0030C37904
MVMTPVERAFALARTGRFRNKSEIARAMRNEGYTFGDLIGLEGTALSRQLALLCENARTTLH